MYKITRYTLIVLLCTLALVGCSTNEEAAIENERKISKEAEKSLSFLFSFPSSTLDPHHDWMGVRAGIAETLVKINEDLEIEPWLAKSYEQIDDTTWEFTIHDHVTFHDGTKVDGEAVKASFERLLEVNDSVNSMLKIESIEAEGQTVTFQTEETFPAFLSELVHTNATIVKVDTDDMTEQPIATGPFKVKSFTPESKVELERYEEYWDGAANLDKVNITFNSDANVRALSLQSNEVDIAYHLPPEALEPIESSDDLRVESVPSLRAHFVLYNQSKPLLQDQNVRKALDLITNRPVMVDEIMSGHATAATGPFNPDFAFASQNDPEEYDPEQAKELLDDAGFEMNENGILEKDGEPLSLTIATYQGRPELPLMAQYLQAEASSIGIQLDIVTIENIDSYLFEQQDEWDLVTYSNLTAPRGDGGYFLNVAYLPDGSLNPGQIDITELNELTEQINQTIDQEKRDDLQQQAVEIIQKEVPQSFILHPHIIVGVNERVTNWEPGSEEYYLITNEMDVEE
ncbi:nickel ABC transporter substrate-binding protein [Bacillus sp. LL01]|uniref:nickel ABC transporter substrate-binding protein n=1 Tax=Bacillus sp. LL01 TaxID=1665556 RepID=UPI00069E3319|nr:nickel ABC transporter substrate-binding protein [Bacillus sp. LL01]